MSSSARIIVALSGGVDSSVAALRLLDEGWDVAGLFMKTSLDEMHHVEVAAERILFETVCSAGDVVPNNTHFDTTRANVEATGATALDLPAPHGLVPAEPHPFKGDMDVGALEAAIAEAGGLMYMDDGIRMETIFGDGSDQHSNMIDKLVGAGKRLLTGESLFMTVFSNRGSSVQHVAFASPYPGKIIPVDLGLHRPERLPHRRGDLIVPHPVEMIQGNHRPVVVRHAGDLLLDDRPYLVDPELLGWPVYAPGRGLVQLDFRSPAQEHADAGIVADSIEPRGKLGPAPESGKCCVGLHEAVLRGILRPA